MLTFELGSFKVILGQIDPFYQVILLTSTVSSFASTPTLVSFIQDIFLKTFFKFIYSFMKDTEKEREAETQAEGEAGSMQAARRGTRSWDSRIRPWAEGSTKLLSHLGCP